MNQLPSHKYLLVILTFLVGVGFAFALPGLVKAQRAAISRTAPLASLENKYNRTTYKLACPSFPRIVSNQSELNNAIFCYATVVAPGSYTITLSKNIDLISSTTDIYNPTAGISLYVDGAGHKVDGQNMPGVRPFAVMTDTHTAFGDITITGGDTTGLSQTGGAGIYNIGYLRLIRSYVTDNHAVGDGGGLKNDIFGNVIIENSAIFSNTAEDGGGINNTASGMVSITNSTVGWNTAVEEGGGIKNTAAARMMIEDSRIINNTTMAADTAGGGLYLTAGSSTGIFDSSISANKSGDSGGGIYVTAGAVLTITDTTVSENKTSLSGGGILGRAGGIISMTNSTVSGNQVTTDTLGSEIGGGGLALLGDAQAHIQFSTIISNSAPSLSLRDGIFITDTADMTMTSSIVANHKVDCLNFNIFTDKGYNLVRDGSCISAGTSLSGDPLVGALQDNTGPTLTHALLDGSQAIDHIPTGANGCGTVIQDDQRGYTRPALKGCDIGAFERGLMYYQPIIYKK